jgi:pilus assembly protein CpaE
VIGARVAGSPLVKHNPKSRAQQAILGLAQSISGKPSKGSSTQMPGPKKGWFGR